MSVGALMSAFAQRIPLDAPSSRIGAAIESLPLERGRVPPSEHGRELPARCRGTALDELLDELGLTEDQVLRAAAAARMRAVVTEPGGA